MGFDDLSKHEIWNKLRWMRALFTTILSALCERCEQNYYQVSWHSTHIFKVNENTFFFQLSSINITALFIFIQLRYLQLTFYECMPCHATTHFTRPSSLQTKWKPPTPLPTTTNKLCLRSISLLHTFSGFKYMQRAELTFLSISDKFQCFLFIDQILKIVYTKLTFYFKFNRNCSRIKTLLRQFNFNLHEFLMKKLFVRIVRFDLNR